MKTARACGAGKNRNPAFRKTAGVARKLRAAGITHLNMQLAIRIPVRRELSRREMPRRRRGINRGLTVSVGHAGFFHHRGVVLENLHNLGGTRAD